MSRWLTLVVVGLVAVVGLGNYVVLTMAFTLAMVWILTRK